MFSINHDLLWWFMLAHCQFDPHPWHWGEVCEWTFWSKPSQHSTMVWQIPENWNYEGWCKNDKGIWAPSSCARRCGQACESSPTFHIEELQQCLHHQFPNLQWGGNAGGMMTMKEINHGLPQTAMKKNNDYPSTMTHFWWWLKKEEIHGKRSNRELIEKN